MMAVCRKIAECSYWLVVVALSGGMWWLVNACLEIKPVWTIPVEDTLQITQYQPSEKLLTGYRVKSKDQIELVVLDAASGMTKASLPADIGKLPNPSSSQVIDPGPRLYGDKVVRFTDRILETGEHEVQFRSWKYASDTDESILATWRTSIEGLQHHNVGKQEWIRTIWSMHEAGLVLVYRYLPTDQIMNYLLSGLNLDLNLGWVEFSRHMALSIWLCDVWQFDRNERQFKQVNQYSISMTDRPSSQSVTAFYNRLVEQSLWTADGRYYTISTSGNQSPSAIKQIEARTGVVTSYSPWHETNQQYGLDTAGDLLLLRRHQVFDFVDKGKVHHQITYAPHKGSKTIWGINEWRPLLEATTQKKIEWPASLDHTIVGEDLFMADAADTTRYLCHNNIWDDSPYWQPLHPGYMVNHFVFMRYLEGKLKVEHQWCYRGRDQWRTSALCGQLFVEGQQDTQLPEWVTRQLAKLPSLWSYYNDKARVGAPLCRGSSYR